MHENLPADAPARLIASRPVRAIEPEKPALEALAVLFEEHIRHLLVHTDRDCWRVVVPRYGV